MSCSEYIKKIEQKNIFILFILKGCPYCEGAMQLIDINNKTYKAYYPNKQILIECIKNKYNYDTTHTTFPFIFYNQQFVGGFDDLKIFI